MGHLLAITLLTMIYITANLWWRLKLNVASSTYIYLYCLPKNNNEARPGQAGPGQAGLSDGRNSGKTVCSDATPVKH